MKHTFVLDEGVVIWAATGRAPDGTANSDALRLLDRLFRNCHAFAVSLEVLARWTRQLDRLRSERRPLSPVVTRLLTSASFFNEKARFFQDPSALPAEGSWSSKLRDDTDFVRLAACCHGVLSTHDGPLIAEVIRLGLHNAHEFQVASVEGSLPLASEPSA